jgi:protein SFI1
VTKLSDGRRLKAALQLWKVKLKERKQAHWRDDMRLRMKTVRDRHEVKLKKDAWAKWRQSYRSHIAEQHHSQQLVLRFFNKWRTTLARLDRLEDAANRLRIVRTKTQKERCWDLWRKAMEMRKVERMMAERVGLRIMSNAMDRWRTQMSVNRVALLLPSLTSHYRLSHQLADSHYDGLVLKHVFNRWQLAQMRTQVCYFAVSVPCSVLKWLCFRL